MIDDMSVFCSNQVTFGGLLDSSRMGSGCQKDQALIRSLEFSASFQGGERGWRLSQSSMANDLINNAYTMEPPQKPLNDGTWKVSRLVNTFN